MNREAREYNETVTPNSAQIERLRAAFPEYFDEQGSFMLDRFEQMLKEDNLNLTREGYELKFLGKSYAKYLAGLETETVVVPDLKHNAESENKDSENLYIVGDNFDALQHLVKSYAGRVKCIYIDPPYNTGSDGFVYNDDFGFTAQQLVDRIGINEDEAERILDMQGKSSHSAWLTFMYPRLVLGRELLSDDGVIFISIDENEVANLRVLGDSIFGEANFAGEIAWKNSSKNDQAYISMQHEMILCWVMDKQQNQGEWREAKNGLKEIYKAFDGFKKQYGSDWDAIHKAALKWYRELADSDPAKDHAHYNFMDELGVFFAGDISGPNYGQYRYDIPHPVTRKPVKEPASGWRFPEETMRQRIADSLVVFGEDETTVPKNKVYLKDNETQSLVSVKYKDGRAATKALKNLLGGDYFTNPKNVDVISDLIQSVTGEKDIIMDFFSGSGTTAQSVMSVNAKRHKKLSFIMVQIPEQIDPKDKAKTSKEAYKAGFRTIDEIGRERIKRAAAKIKEETGADIDYGFKLVRLESPSVKTLDELDSFTPDPAEVIAGDYVSKFDLDGTSGREVVLTTWLNQDGFGLLAKPRKVELADYVLDVCEDSAYIIDTGISSEDVQELVRLLETNELQLSRVVVFPYSVTFSLMHELKKNLSVLKSGQSVEVIERF